MTSEEQAKKDLMNSYRLLGFDHIEKSNCLPLYVENEKNKFTNYKPYYNFKFHKAKKLYELKVKYLSPPNDYFNNMGVEYEYIGLYYDLFSGDYCTLRKAKRLPLEKDSPKEYNKKIRYRRLLEIGLFDGYNNHLRKTSKGEIWANLSLIYDSHKIFIKKKMDEKINNEMNKKTEKAKKENKKLLKQTKKMVNVKTDKDDSNKNWEGIVL